jgi:hypothetical protein
MHVQVVLEVVALAILATIIEDYVMTVGRETGIAPSA